MVLNVEHLSGKMLGCVSVHQASSSIPPAKPLPTVQLDAGEDKTPRQRRESDGQNIPWGWKLVGMGKYQYNQLSLWEGFFYSQMVEFGKLQVFPSSPRFGAWASSTGMWGISSHFPAPQLPPSGERKANF